MKQRLLQYLVGYLISLLSPELLRGLMDTLLDWVENSVLGSASKVDDKLVLPVCALIRETFNIPDDDE